jgi:hypothetical protein
VEKKRTAAILNPRPAADFGTKKDPMPSQATPWVLLIPLTDCRPPVSDRLVRRRDARSMAATNEQLCFCLNRDHGASTRIRIIFERPTIATEHSIRQCEAHV